MTPNDLSKILTAADIKKIFVNGKTAERYYNKYTKAVIGREALCLPSTSPANAAWTLEKLIDAWKVLREIILSDLPDNMTGRKFFRMADII